MTERPHNSPVDAPAALPVDACSPRAVATGLTPRRCSTCDLRWTGRPGDPCPSSKCATNRSEHREVSAYGLRHKMTTCTGCGRTAMLYHQEGGHPPWMCGVCEVRREASERASRAAAVAGPQDLERRELDSARADAALDSVARLARIIRRAGGYMAPADQHALWEAEAMLVAVGRSVER